MKKSFLFIFSTSALLVSCGSLFVWEKIAKAGTEIVDNIPPKLRAWERASRDSAHLAPLPQEDAQAVVQAYAAALWGLRGLVADHTWISTKQKEADSYTVYEVIGWRMTMGHNSVLRIATDIPDRLWYGKTPRVLLDLRGREAERVIDRIHTAAVNYPYKKEYKMVFGPNSNTFTAWIACRVPELSLNLSRRAIGKNYVKNCRKKTGG